jgi:uncharacterized protein YqgC (DUF456 family)
MKVSVQAGKISTSAGLASPAIIVVLVILLGAVLYLWRTRYIRRKTAYFMMGVLLLILILFGAYVYTYGG